MPVIRTIAACCGCLLLASCGGLWGGADKPEAPLTPQLPMDAGGDVVDDGAVAKAPPVVDPSSRRRVPDILEQIDPAVAPLSRRYVRPVETGPAVRKLDDGEPTGRQIGRMERVGDAQWRFVFEADADQDIPLEPLTILPNAYLQEMERIVGERAGEDVVFGVSGEVTRYRGRGFLVIRSAVLQSAPPKPQQ